MPTDGESGFVGFPRLRIRAQRKVGAGSFVSHESITLSPSNKSNHIYEQMNTLVEPYIMLLS